jgi:hypothetical protein
VVPPIGTLLPTSYYLLLLPHSLLGGTTTEQTVWEVPGG